MSFRESKPFLTISHYIYLNREQRYKIFEGETLEVIGVSVPVWFKSGSTSEPAKEVFCKYILTKEKNIYGISLFNEGYKINFTSFDNGLDTKMLLDVKDKGAEGLVAKGYSKISIEGKNFNVFHYLEIKPIETLMDTIIN